jgi:hypothetical protein
VLIDVPSPDKSQRSASSNPEESRILTVKSDWPHDTRAHANAVTYSTRGGSTSSRVSCAHSREDQVPRFRLLILAKAGKIRYLVFVYLF